MIFLPHQPLPISAQGILRRKDSSSSGVAPNVAVAEAASAVVEMNCRRFIAWILNHSGARITKRQGKRLKAREFAAPGDLKTVAAPGNFVSGKRQRPDRQVQQVFDPREIKRKPDLLLCQRAII